MRYLVTGSQMRKIDAYAIETIGIPSMVLMERAALAVAEEVQRLAGKTDCIWSVCGTGNNGGDGIAAARILFLRGFDVQIILCGDIHHGTEEFSSQLAIAEQLGIAVTEFQDFIPGTCQVLIDALFGAGLSREIKGEYLEAIRMMEDCRAGAVIAVDIPSGIHSDNGHVMGAAVKADVTVTFGYEKLGTVLYPGRAYSGRVVVKDIGFPDEGRKKAGAEAFTYGAEDLCRFPKRPAYSNKGTFGKVLVIAGSENMSGAAYFSALSAYRIGAGLVKVFTAESNRQILQQQLPEAILETYDPAQTNPEQFGRQVARVCEWADVVVLGPGLGQKPYALQLVEEVLVNACGPIVMDADALNIIGAHPVLTRYYTENIIITPHLGEMCRLTGKTIKEIQENLWETVEEYSSLHGITCVLKDAVTIITGKEGQFYLNTSGNSGMAKAGAGDVLTGVIAGLLAQGEEIWEAATLGTYLHGLAGDRCKADMGDHGILARDLANRLGMIREYTAEAER